MKGLSMNRNRMFAGAVALVCSFASSVLPAYAGAMDYRFELVGKPKLVGQKDIVQVRLVHAMNGMDSMPVPDAVIFDTKADMGPGMESMTAPIKPVAAEDGIYSFEIAPSVTGTWVLYLAAKIEGEPGTFRGTVKADLVK
jgi:hypothetical protein